MFVEVVLMISLATGQPVIIGSTTRPITRP